MNNQTKQASLLLATLLVMPMSNALAAYSTGTGLATAQTMATDVRDNVFIAVGILAGLYLIYVGVLVWLDKKTWGDWFQSLGGVALIGGSITAAAWAWAAFQ